MKAIGIIGATLLAFGLGAGIAAAMPQPPAVEGNGLVTKVQVDCHADMRRHYLPQYGRSVWHRHRQSNCRVILADPDNRPRDCHRDVRRHYLPQYGRSLYHRHVGENCRIRIYDEYRGGKPGSSACVKIGPLTLCESRN